MADCVNSVSSALEELGDGWDSVWPKIKEFWGDGGDRTREKVDAWINGSHASGLTYVPWDGYIAQLHQGERVLTAEQARAMDTLSGSFSPPGAVTAADLRTVTASAVNALGAIGNNGGRYVFELHWNVNGKELYRETIEDFRAVSKEMPEVLDDR